VVIQIVGTIYLNYDDVLATHNQQVDDYGGGDGIRSDSLLRSSIDRPKQTFDGTELYPDVYAKAAALAHSLAENQPFVDGNKRTAIASAIMFLDLNGYEQADEDADIVDQLYDATMKMANHEIDNVGLEKVLRELFSEKQPQTSDEEVASE